MKPRNS